MNSDQESYILSQLAMFSRKLPKFSDGRIDYSNSDIAMVLTIFVEYKGKLLILKRSDKVAAYKGKWNAVAGYLDEIKPLAEKIKEELSEELGINENIEEIKIGQFYQYFDQYINKKWLITPVLATFKKEPEIKLDWEYTEYKWIEPAELADFDTVSGLEDTYFHTNPSKKDYTEEGYQEINI